MTRRKDPQPDEVQPDDVQPEPPPTEPFVTEVSAPAAAEPVPVDPIPEPRPELLAPPPQRGPGVFAPLLGGALAAVGGFALSHFNAFGLAPASVPVDLAPLSAQIEAAGTAQTAALDTLSADLSALSNRIAALEGAPAPDLSRLDALDQRLAAIETMPADGTASTAALTSKLAELEQRIATLPAGGTDPALQEKLDAALSRLSEAEASATSRAAEAEAAAKAAARAMAIDDLSAAVASGQPFATELQALADPTLTETLGPIAETGAPTLGALQETFPDAAREAIRIARDLSVEDGWGDRLVDFLASQTEARSLTPLDGDTPDAILSRAEFALAEGRVGDALAELDPLDPAVKAPLDPWIAQAQAHLAANAALQTARGE
jgi:hypothetical protein